MMDTQKLQLRRSLIFVPGTRPDMMPKALTTGADMVCIDLEDAVAPDHKTAARDQTLELFREPQADDGVERIVRINCLRSAEGLRDVLAVIDSRSPPPALMLTKVQCADEVRQLDDLLCDGPQAEIRFHVIIETNDGLDDCYRIARASSRIDSLLFGAVDMAAELRTAVTWDTLLYARSRLVHAAAGAGVDLCDVPHLDLNDPEGLAREAAASAALGFTGKAAIHPKQIGPINTAFTASADEIARAREIIAAFDRAEGGLVVIDGKLIERPVLRSMERVAAIADRMGL